jgi:hypothetical protein
VSVRDPLTVRLWQAILIGQEDDCWPWLAGRSQEGYGKIQDKGKTLVATRVVYELTKGPIPEGLGVCHSCDNPPCCNPKHLWLGTVKQNTHDAMHKNRLAKGERIASSKRTREEVLRIIELSKQGVRNIDIAKQLGCSEANVGFIVTGTSWRHLTGGKVRPVQPKCKLTKDQVRTIKSMSFALIKKGEVASLLGVQPSVVSRILSGERWGNV